MRHWANGGETTLANLVLLCPTHHRLVHEGEFGVRRLNDGAFRFTLNGAGVGPSKPSEPSAPGTIIAHSRSWGSTSAPGRPPRARWLGEPVDYDHALLVLMAAWDAGHYPPRSDSSLPA